MDKKSTSQMIDGLIGQANVEHARGNSSEAISLLHEAIRQAPNYVDAYNQLSDVYSDLNQTEKSFEFKMLAARMSSKTSAEDWADVGEMALTMERLDDASACYEKAIRCDPQNWTYYEKRIEVLETVGMDEKAMRTRLQGAKMIDCGVSQVSFQWLQDLIKTVAEYYISQNDEDKAMEALETFILRSREFSRPADAQHLTLLGMWMARDKYLDCVKSILALHDGIRPYTASGNLAIKITFSSNEYTVEPFPPESIKYWDVDASFRTPFLARLIVSFIRIGLKEFVPILVDKLLEREVGPDDDLCFLEVGRAYQATSNITLGIQYMMILLQKAAFKCNADAWFLSGILLQANNQVDDAKSAYEKVIEIQPAYVDARINLSTILQNMGKADQALDTLKDYDLDSCSQLPDERLLIRQAEVLLEQKLMSQYVKCVRLLLVPHFFSVNQMMTSITGPVRSRGNKITISHTLKRNVFDSLRGSALERLVKRLGSVAFTEGRSTDELSGIQVHDYALKVVELLHDEQRFEEMLQIICYSFLHPKIVRAGLPTFQHLLLYGSIKAENYPLGFEYLRFSYLYLMNRTVDTGKEEAHQLLFCRIFNAMNYVFSHHQSVGYHRFVMRALAKTPENYPLHMISGNNSLITGSYRHALGEYFRVWLNNKDDPLVCLLIALTFTHMACKKDISSRHMIGTRAITFMKQYQKIRGCNQEADYNVGRMMHQLGILSGAIFFYERVLNQSEAPMIYRVNEQTGENVLEQDERYDLKRLAAYNLALIYETSGNRMLAREILEKFCTI